MNKRKVVLYISMSLDGFIATKDDDLSWLSLVQKEGFDYGYANMMKRSDTYLVGRKTYEIVLDLCHGTFPQAEQLNCIVLTRQNRPSENGVEFYSGQIKALINELKAKPGKDIYCDGGSEIVKLLMNENLIDEYIISVIPTILGDGIRLFAGEIKPINLKLLKSESFETGLVQLHYERIN
jgi:dihydrofolate reductase